MAWDAQQPKVPCGECGKKCDEGDMEFDKWDHTLLCSDCKHEEGKVLAIVKEEMELFGYAKF